MPKTGGAALTVDRALPFKSLTNLTRLLRVSLLISIVLLAASAIASWVEALSWARQPADVDPNVTLLPVEQIGAWLSLIYLGVMIYLAIVFLTWVFRATKNLLSLTDVPMSTTPGWAVGWYFVPVFCWFKPYQGMRDIWRASHGTALEDGYTTDSWGLVKLWWLLWLSSVFLALFGLPHTVPGETLPSYLRAAQVNAGLDTLEVVLHIVTFLMIGRVGRAYDRNVDEVGIMTRRAEALPRALAGIQSNAEA